ncbi:MAG: ATP-dependent DNA ligase [Candidatus Nanoarchaeia archaeon]|nr:ATP-dependent DNA ligase [Candidatus Nanoarchaeia archaeon]
MIDEFISTLEKISNTKKRLEKTEILALFINKYKKNMEKEVLYFFLGNIYPENSQQKTYVFDKIIIKAITQSLGYNEKEIEDIYKEKGDLGDIVFKLLKNKKQNTLFDEDLEMDLLIKNLNKLTEFSGNDSTSQKISIISELLSKSNSNQARFTIRLLQENLRIGISIQTIRDSLIHVYFPKVNFIYKKCKNHGYSLDLKKCIICKEELLDIENDSNNDSNNNLNNNLNNNSLNSNSLNSNLLNGNLINIDNLNNEEIKIKFDSIDLNKELILFNKYEDSRKFYQYLIDLMNEKYSFVNDIGQILKILKENPNNIRNVNLDINNPIKAMLFPKVKTIQEAFDVVGKPAQLEYKYDGFRMIIHYNNKDDIRIYTRNLEELSGRFPDVIEYLKESLGNKEKIILDGECLGIKDEKIIPFQQISQRIMRKYDIDRLKTEFPVKCVFFDILMVNNKDLTKENFIERRKILEDNVKVIKNKIEFSQILVTQDNKEAMEFYNKALKDGMEGIMIKNIKSPYSPGSRVGHAVKLKPTLKELDLIITRAEYGSGKRAGLFTSYYVAIKDRNNLKEIGKVSSGLKEKEEEGLTFEYITNLLKDKIIKEEGNVITLTPEVILEIKYEEIQKSDNYDSGFALRFPRIIRLRPDKDENEISTIEEIKKIYEKQRGRNGHVN